jgi:hypothetical protein
VLILTTLVGVRLTIALRPRVAWTRPPAGLTVPAVAMVGAAAVLLSPVLYAIMVRTFEGRMVAAPVLWRSSAPGVDAIAWLMPNPNHPLAPRALVDWVSRQPGQYEENVSAIPWAALLVMVVAWRRAGHRPHRAWTAIGLFFASLAMGPFVRLAGINTFVPTPWAFLRYAPLIGDARMPARFSVIVVMAAAIVFAGALTAIVRRYPRRRAVVLATVGSALAFELLPAPRTLYSAEVPPVYDTVARDPRPLRVLELPFGIRDGLSSLGDFNASSLFFQTWHQKPLIGGYLSRVSEFHKAQYRSRPVMAALLAKSEGRSLARAEEDLARQTAKDFLREARIGWVIVDMNRASPALVQFAVETLRLTRLSQTGAFALYVPEESGLE